MVKAGEKWTENEEVMKFILSFADFILFNNVSTFFFFFYLSCMALHAISVFDKV